MGFEYIAEIRNHAATRAKIYQSLSTTPKFVVEPGQSLTVPPGAVGFPGASGGVQPESFIRIEVEGVGLLRIWQSSYGLEDRVRVWGDGPFEPPGQPIGLFASMGPAELWKVGLERTLIINDFTTWLLPTSVSKTLTNMHAAVLQDSYRIDASNNRRAIESVPKKSAVCFSMPGIPSDAFDRKQQGARFLYRDSGKRYEFQIRNGAISFQPPANGLTAIPSAISYDERCAGELIEPLPQFDMVAANAGRVFAKEKGVDCFYFALLDHGYIHAIVPGTPEFSVPSVYFKLDPEFNKRRVLFDSDGIRREPWDLRRMAHHLYEGFVQTRAFGGHPATERWPAYRALMSYGLIEAAIVRSNRLTWYRIDARPPAVNPVTRLPAALDPSFPDYETVKLQLERSDEVRTFKVVPTEPPSWAPSYQHVSYLSTDTPLVWQKSVDYKLVLDIGVGHVHHHEQYEGITGGECQPLRAKSFPDDIFETQADFYRFLNGPVADGDGFVDGTANYYLLVQLKTDEEIRQIEQSTLIPNGTAQTALIRNAAYALLYSEEQGFFTQRWRIAHPDDWQGMSASVVAAIHNRPDRYLYKRERFWCPFRTGHVGPRSRLAVAAQVVLVNGECPDNGKPLLLSTNFSFVSMDVTWRWRAFPAPVRYFDGATLWSPRLTKLTGDEQIPPGTDACVYPQTVRLRDDMTICLQGRGPGIVGNESGRWYQRYLPSTNVLAPPLEAIQHTELPVCGVLLSEIGKSKLEISALTHEKDELTKPFTGEGPAPIGSKEERNERILEINERINELEALLADLEKRMEENDCYGTRRPSADYQHPWKFMTESVFKRVDQFSHFGVYDIVDSRMQFYFVTPESEGAAAVLAASETGGWIDDSKQLEVEGYGFRLDWMRLPLSAVWTALLAFKLVIEIIWKQVLGKNLPSTDGPPSSDDHNGPPPVPRPFKSRILPPSLFNRDTRLRIVRRGQQWIAMYWDKRDDDLVPLVEKPFVVLDYGEGRELAKTGRKVKVKLSAQQKVPQPPGVSLASLRWIPRDPSGPLHASVNFVPSRLQDPFSNVWRVRMAALDPTRGVVTLMDKVTTPDNFTPLADGSFEYTWLPASTADLRKYSNHIGAIEFGTSIWFEDVVGHVSVPDQPVKWPSSDATFVRHQVPTSMIAGRKYPVSVTMRNTGITTWTSGGANSFGLGANRDSDTWGLTRRGLPSPVSPGGEVTFAFDVIAPAPGAYRFQWRMLQELIEWFGDLTDMPVQVTAAPVIQGSVGSTSNTSGIGTQQL
ncbi:MAG TPA: hypothetical protein VHQ94_07130 [Pyrinomonadaceae bacterium]|jgi:hypothetical protein|nr:hypothetical protein [Pyrinomonadaceae bacterium]